MIGGEKSRCFSFLQADTGNVLRYLKELRQSPARLADSGAVPCKWKERARCTAFSRCFTLFLAGFVHVVANGETRISDEFFYRAWQAEDGLPENRVVGIAQSPDGFLWVATQAGLVRFDGVDFQPVELMGGDTLFAGTLWGLLGDRNGRLWLAKEGGVVVMINGNQVLALTHREGLPQNEKQRSMAVDGEGNLWVAYTTGKVIRYREGHTDNFGDSEGLPASGVASLTSAADGQLWFAKEGRVGVFRDGAFQVLHNFQTSALRIAPAHSGGVWVSSGQTLFKLEATGELLTQSEITGAIDRAATEPTSLLEDHLGAVWLGTVSAGLFRFNSNDVVRVETSHAGILSLAEDQEGNLWVGTHGGGLDRVRRRVTSLISSSSGLPFESAQSVAQDMTGALWAVGQNGVLARQEDGEWKRMLPESGGARMFWNCVVADASGPVWIGARGGSLFQWKDGRFLGLGLRSKLGNQSIRSLLVSTLGDVWIGTDDPRALFRLTPATMEIKSIPLPPGYRFIRALTEDASGGIWLGASDGLLMRVRGEDVTDFTARSGGRSVRCLHGAANGDVWVGTAGFGILRLRNEQLNWFGSAQGIPNEFVSQILADGRGSVWFAGNQGIFQVAARSFDEVAAGRATRVSPIVFGRNEGIQGLQASFDFHPSATRTADNQLLFSTLTGLAEVRLDFLRENPVPPRVFIERVVNDGVELPIYPRFTFTPGGSATNRTAETPMAENLELELPPGPQLVQFKFTGLNFTAPERTRFRYQLEGLDHDWVDAGPRRVADYTHPPPGRYRFKVIACNDDGVWNETGDSLTVEIAAYFWETLWFKSAAIVLGSGAACGFVVVVLRRRHRRELEHLEHQRALESERSRIARDLHDDLGVGLTEIGLLGDLAGSPDVPERSRQRLQEMTGRARSLAASLDEIVWAINPANDTSQSLVDYFFPYAQRLLGRASIRCRLEVVDPLPAGNLRAEDRHEFFHAYKEALNNIIRHSGATQVTIRFATAGAFLLIRVSDNGRGLEASGDRRTGQGLAGMRERLEQLGGRCEITSNPGAGTTVAFNIPVENPK